jgi:hypothetical protein
MTKVPWKGRETPFDHQVFVATKVGQCVSVDQLISMQVGFIVQLKGTLTKKRYTVATVFGNVSPFVGSTPISRTALQKKPSGTSSRVQGNSSSMHANDGQPPSTWPFGHMPSGVPSTFTTPYLSWKMEPQG